jgi:hypothetical protein
MKNRGIKRVKKESGPRDPGTAYGLFGGIN